MSFSIEGPKQCFVGQPVEWSLVLTNDGDAILTNVAIRDRLPAELGLVTAEQGGRMDGTDVLWTLGQMGRVKSMCSR